MLVVRISAIARSWNMKSNMIIKTFNIQFMLFFFYKFRRNKKTLFYCCNLPLFEDFRSRFRLVAGEAPAPNGEGVRLN